SRSAVSASTDKRRTDGLDEKSPPDRIVSCVSFSVPDRIGGDDDEKPRIEVRLHDDLPVPASVAGFDHPTPFDYVASVIACPLHHSAKIDLREPTIEDPPEQVRAEFELPIPPRRPLVLRQVRLPRITKFSLAPARLKGYRTRRQAAASEPTKTAA